MNRRKEVAKFACGFEAFHALAHAYFWMAGVPFMAFGIIVTPTWSVISVGVHAAASISLGVYAWRRIRA
jgi:hypothetical protein